MCSTQQLLNKVAKSPARLTGKVTPSFYDIKIIPDIAAATFCGEETITLYLQEAVSVIVIHAAELTISKAVLRNDAGSSFISTVSFDEEKQQALISLEGSAGPGEWFLHLSFQGILNNRLRGFYRSSFRDADGSEKLIATTKFEPSDARRAFPCFDEPEFKAVFQISLLVDKGLTAISNSPINSEREMEGGKKLVSFAPSLKMSSYLVAYVVGDFSASEPVFTKSSVPIRVCCVPGKKHLTAYALKWAKFSIDFFADYFGIDYQGAKLDLIAIPDFASGAMENFGAITFRETALLLDETQATHAELMRVAEVVCHENAHMWFGDLVTMDWWNGLWLNEAFATFMAALAVQAFMPSWKFFEGFNIFKAGAMRIDGLHSSRSIEFPVESPEDARAMFDVLTYEKGCAILRMLELYIGEEVFRQGCATYMKRHACLNTETADLWNALAEAVRNAGLSIPVDELMDTWVFQQGFPLVSVERAESEGVIILRQRPFRYLDEGSTPQGLWYVPIAIRAGTSDGIIEKVFLLKQTEQRFYVGENLKWIVINADGQGFYRVSYADELAQQLLSHLSELSAPERFNLASDLWAATQAGHLTLDAYLARLRIVLSEETDSHVFALAINSIGYLRRICAAGGPEHFNDLVNLAKQLFEPALIRLGWEPKASESPQDAELRASLVSTLGSLGEKSCCQKVESLWKQYLSDRKSVSTNLLPALVETTASHGDASCYDQMLKLKESASTPQEETRFLFALSHFRHPELIERTLASSLNGQIRVQDVPQMIRSLFLNPTGGLATWNFVKAHWDKMVATIPLQGIIRLCDGITALVNPELEPELKEFFATHNIKGNEKALAQNLETLTIANRFLLREREQLGSVLAKNTR